MKPILIRPHLIQKRTSFALLQFLLDLGGNVLQRGELVQTHDMNLTMRVRSAVLLVLVADFQRYSTSKGSASRSHVAAEKILTAPKFIIAARASRTHAQA